MFDRGRIVGIATDIIDTLQLKNKHYGNAFLHVPRFIEEVTGKSQLGYECLIVRMLDKICRELVSHDSENFKDIAGYALLALQSEKELEDA